MHPPHVEEMELLAQVTPYKPSGLFSLQQHWPEVSDSRPTTEAADEVPLDARADADSYLGAEVLREAMNS